MISSKRRDEDGGDDGDVMRSDHDDWLKNKNVSTKQQQPDKATIEFQNRRRPALKDVDRQ